MAAQEVRSAVPRVEGTNFMQSVPALNLSSICLMWGAMELSKTVDMALWLPRSAYLSDLWIERFGTIMDGMRKGST